MKKQATFIAVYAALVLIGGLVGYLVAGSIASILMSGTFALALFACSHYMAKGNGIAYTCASALVFCLTLFFTYRFLLSFKIAPGGIMMVLSAALFIFLLRSRSLIKAV